MTLYFVNGSKQRKELIESDYAEDIIDVMLDFFEEHSRFPHILEYVRCKEGAQIMLGHSAEHFYIEDIGEDAEAEINEWINSLQ